MEDFFKRKALCDNPGLSMDTRLSLLKVRECGDCVVCCVAPNIADLKKAAGDTCEHCTGSGCEIYEGRPDICKGYLCGYVMGWDVEWPKTRGIAWTIQTSMVVGHTSERINDVRPKKDEVAYLMTISMNIGHTPPGIVIRNAKEALCYWDGRILRAKMKNGDIDTGSIRQSGEYELKYD